MTKLFDRAVAFVTKYPRFFKALGLAVAALILAGTGYALGRYLTPPREVVRVDLQERMKIQEVVKYVDRVVIKKVAAVTTRTEERPDGTKITTVVDRKADTSSAETSREASHAASAERVLEVAREVKSLPDWSVGVLVGYDGRSGSAVVGGQVERRLVGPLKASAWLMGVPAAGPQSMAGGLGLAVEF